MSDLFQLRHIMGLIKRNLPSLRVLTMSDSTIREVTPSDLQFSKDLLESFHYFNDDVPRPGKLEIVNMFGHHATELPRAVKLITEFGIDIARKESELLGDSREFQGESSRCINKSGAWFITMQDLFLGVESLKSWNLSQQRDLTLREVKVHLPFGLAN